MKYDLKRNPDTEILIVRNEDMKSSPQTVYNSITEWLNISHYELSSSSRRRSLVLKNKMVTKYRTAPMSNQTRQELKEFYEPYNQRLYELLGWNDKNKKSHMRWW